MFQWYRNIQYQKALKNKVNRIDRAVILKVLKEKSKKELITMITVLGQENILLKKKAGLL